MAWRVQIVCFVAQGLSENNVLTHLSLKGSRLGDKGIESKETVCVCVCVCVCACVCVVCMCVHVYMCVHVCVCTRVLIHVCLCVPERDNLCV